MQQGIQKPKSREELEIKDKYNDVGNFHRGKDRSVLFHFREQNILRLLFDYLNIRKTVLWVEESWSVVRSTFIEDAGSFA